MKSAEDYLYTFASIESEFFKRKTFAFDFQAWNPYNNVAMAVSSWKKGYETYCHTHFTNSDSKSRFLEKVPVSYIEEKNIPEEAKKAFIDHCFTDFSDQYKEKFKNS